MEKQPLLYIQGEEELSWKVNYCLVKNMTLNATDQRSPSESGLWVLAEMKIFIGPINLRKKQHSADHVYEDFLCEDHQTALLFSLHLQFTTAFCSTFP